jgi:hypothetical protein
MYYNNIYKKYIAVEVFLSVSDSAKAHTKISTLRDGSKLIRHVRPERLRLRNGLKVNHLEKILNLRCSGLKGVSWLML